MSSTDASGPRLIVTSDDHRAVLVIVVVTCLLWSIFVIGARAIWRVHQRSDFGLDDTVATFGTILSAAQAGVTLAAVHFGFGKRSTIVADGDVEIAGKYLYAAAILYVLCMCASRASMSLLIARLTRNKTQILWTRIVLLITVLWGIASTFAIAFECGIPVNFMREADSTCTGLFASWAAIEIIGLIIEVAILGMAVALVANLQMQQKFKTAVVGSFSLRVFLIIPVAFRLNLQSDVADEANPFFANINLAIVTQIILHYSLWAASFPCMRAFLRAFDTGMGVTTHVSTHKGSNYALEEIKGSAYGTGSADRSKAGRMQSTTVPDTRGQEAVEKVVAAHNANTQAGQTEDGRVATKGRPSDETASESSRKAIITRTVEWQVNYEDVPGRAV